MKSDQQYKKDTNKAAKRQDYTSWADFGVEEYVQSYYGRKILDEDVVIINEVIKTLRSLGIRPGSLTKVADVGAGPNIYPAMLLSPFVKPKNEGGKIDLIEFGSANRKYVQSVLDGNDTGGLLAGVWDKFEHELTKHGKAWSGALDNVKEKAQVISGSIYDLPHEVYDAVSSYFVAESITDDFAKFEKAVASLIDSVNPGGLIMIAHTLESKGYYAGQDNFFPAVAVGIEDLKKVYEGKASVQITRVDAAKEVREGYDGMAIALGKKL